MHNVKLSGITYDLLLGSANPLKKAAYIGLIFDTAPTYQELISGTVSSASYFKLIKESEDSDPATVTQLTDR